MRRLLALAILLSLCAGCKNRPATLDPFLGRTKVPPPSTGAIGAQAPGAWNYPAAPPTLNTTNSGGSIYSPPGGFAPNTGTGGAAPTSPFSTTPTAPASGGAASPPVRFTGTSGAAPISSTGGGSNGQAIRIVDPPAGTTPAAASRSGTFTGAGGGGVDIMSLPAAGRSPQTADGSGRATQQSFVQPATPGAAPITSGIDLATARNSTIPGQEPRYGFDGAYTHLNGRVEFSQADRRWLLHYIEPGLVPDKLGGVVVLAPATPVALRNGDFVSVRGRVEASGNTSLPSFTATNVFPQREVR